MRPSAKPPFIVWVWRVRSEASLGPGWRRERAWLVALCEAPAHWAAARCRSRYVWGVCGITLLPSGTEGPPSSTAAATTTTTARGWGEDSVAETDGDAPRRAPPPGPVPLFGEGIM